MERMKILVTAKTYPNLSVQYDELVCTAGVRENGSWVRLYPIPFRSMDYEKQYKKYQWIEVNVRHNNSSDQRPESYRPEVSTLQCGKALDTKNNWAERKVWVLKKVYEDMEELITLNQRQGLSLVVFKAKQMLNFSERAVSEKEHAEHESKCREILDKRRQQSLLEDDALKNIIPVSKPDYHFYYKFIDKQGKTSEMQIVDWEIQALYRNCRRRKSQTQALADVRKKYWDDFAVTKDLYLFLGTTKQRDGWVKNPFTIIGTFTPKTGE